MARARRIAMYVPVGRELDSLPLAHQAWSRGRSLFLPVISGSAMRFAPFRPGTEMRPNQFGILEPVTHRGELLGARHLDVIVAPLVAFDEEGNRLGMGGGYYDRTLAFLSHRTSVRRPRFVALAFEIQKVEALPVEEWDVRLDVVVTEKSTYRFS